LYESAEKLNILFGNALLLGLISSNIFFQTTVFNLLRGFCATKDSAGTIGDFFSHTMVLMTVDLGRIAFPFITCHSILNEVR